jgi:hypothetical protein
MSGASRLLVVSRAVLNFHAKNVMFAFQNSRRVSFSEFCTTSMAKHEIRPHRVGKPNEKRQEESLVRFHNTELD